MLSATESTPLLTWSYDLLSSEEFGRAVKTVISLVQLYQLIVGLTTQTPEEKLAALEKAHEKVLADRVIENEKCKTTNTWCCCFRYVRYDIPVDVSMQRMREDAQYESAKETLISQLTTKPNHG